MTLPGPFCGGVPGRLGVRVVCLAYAGVLGGPDWSKEQSRWVVFALEQGAEGCFTGKHLGHRRLRGVTDLAGVFPLFSPTPGAREP